MTTATDRGNCFQVAAGFLRSGIIETANDKDLRISRETYYRVGQLDEAHVWRFTPDEARRRFRKTRHCGPWVPGWQSMGL